MTHARLAFGRANLELRPQIVGQFDIDCLHRRAGRRLRRHGFDPIWQGSGTDVYRGRVAHTMKLEAQETGDVDQEARIDAYIRNVLKRRDLWNEP